MPTTPSQLEFSWQRVPRGIRVSSTPTHVGVIAPLRQARWLAGFVLPLLLSGGMWWFLWDSFVGDTSMEYSSDEDTLFILVILVPLAFYFFITLVKFLLHLVGKLTITLDKQQHTLSFRWGWGLLSYSRTLALAEGWKIATTLPEKNELALQITLANNQARPCIFAKNFPEERVRFLYGAVLQFVQQYEDKGNYNFIEDDLSQHLIS